MKTKELNEWRKFFRLCNELNVASWEQNGEHQKVVFYQSEPEPSDQSGLDAGAITPDPVQASKPAPPKKPQTEGPYPAAIFQDGELPSF